MLKRVAAARREQPTAKSRVCPLPYRQIDAEGSNWPTHEVLIESMLHVNERNVVHCNLGENYVYKSWHFASEETEQVMQASWASFDDSHRKWVAILVNAEVIALHSENGSYVEVALPVAIESMWPLRRGLLLQGVPSRSQLTKYLILTHPLNELKEARKRSCLNERVICLDQNFLVTHDGNSHSIWCLRWIHRTSHGIDMNENVSDTYPNESAGAPFVASLVQSRHSVTGDGRQRVLLNEAKMHNAPDLELLFTFVRRCASSPVACKAFLATDLSGSRMVCLVMIKTLLAFPDEAEAAFEIQSCLDAAPVATRAHEDIIDIILLHEDHSLHLVRGKVSIARLMIVPHCDVTTKPLKDRPNSNRDGEFDCWQAMEIESSIVSNNIEQNTTVIGLKNAIGNRLTLCLRGSDEKGSVLVDLRVELELGDAHPCVAACLEVLDEQVSPYSAVAIRVAMVQADVDPWIAFINTIRFVIGEAQPLGYKNVVSAWDVLLSTDYHVECSVHLRRFWFVDSELSETSSFHEGGPAVSVEAYARIQAAVEHMESSGLQVRLAAKQIVKALYFVYENFKLSLFTWIFVQPLGVFLASINKEAEYAYRLSRDMTGISTTDQRHQQRIFLAADVHDWLEATMIYGLPQYTLETIGIRSQYNRSVLLSRVFSEFSRDAPCADKTELVYRLVLAMVDEKFKRKDIGTWPPGVALPFYDALLACRLCPPSDWPADAYWLIGRDDLALLQDPGPVRSAVEVYPAVEGDPSDLEYSSRDERRETTICVAEDGRLQINDAPDSFVETDRELNEFLSLPHEDGARVSDAFRMLDSSSAVSMHLERPPEISDHQFEHEKQKKLLVLCKRSSAAPCGRAMLTMSSFHQHDLTEALKIPELCHHGKITPSNMVVNLDASSMLQLGVWPDFHNGVAAGLSLPSAEASRAEGRYRSGSRTWILYNRPKAPSPKHAGFLLALGLLRRLDALAMTDLYEYLAFGDDHTTVGVLLGMAACKRGSCDVAVSKMLCLHIPSLLPQPFTDMDVSPTAQAAALLGVGLLYQCSASRLMAEFLLTELSKPVYRDGDTRREAYSLAAGLALGMVIFGIGTSYEAAGLADLRISDRLHHAIDGGRKASVSFSILYQVASRLDNDDIECPLSNLLGDECLDHATTTATRRSGSSRGVANACKSSRVREGDNVNTNMTAAGAILAHGMFFAFTNCQSAAELVKLPDTLVLLDAVRPDFIVLRIVSSALILWDEVAPEFRWVERQVPSVVSQAIESRKDPSGDVLSELVDYDWNTILQVHAHVIVGCCLAIGIRFAGTGCKVAAKTLLRYLLHFKSMRAAFFSKTTLCGSEDDALSLPDRFRQAWQANPLEEVSTTDIAAPERTTVQDIRPDRSTVEMGLSVVAVAVSLVMAGTGDANLLRELRQLRRRCDAGVPYGTYQAIHMAIGLIFLGGCRASLSRSKEAVAALLCAVFPRFPAGPDDNQYYLQPLRHLWILAVEWRGLRVVDVDSREIMPVHVKATLTDKADWATPCETVKLKSPCLLPPLSDIALLEPVSDDIYPVRMTPCRDHIHGSSSLHIVLFVKRRSTNPSFSALSKLLGNFMASGEQYKRPYYPFSGFNKCVHPKQSFDLLASFVNEPWLLLFTRLFCEDVLPEEGLCARSESISVRSDSALSKVCIRILSACSSSDKLCMMPAYLQLYHYARQVSSSGESLQAWSLRLCLQYWNATSLLRSTLMANTDIDFEDFVVAIYSYLGQQFSGLNLRNSIRSIQQRRVLGCLAILSSVLKL